MIEPAILAAIRARLDRAQAVGDLRYRPFVVAGVTAGLIDDARADRLAGFGPNLFIVQADAVMLADRLADESSRSSALRDVALALRAEGALPAWRDEIYAVATEFRAPTLACLERGAARYFGIRTWAAHVNGVVGRDPAHMWFARRSPAKAVDPGLLDNLVGGGIAANLSVEQTVIKEAWEEAGIDAALARRARPTGIVHVTRPMFDGLQRETVFVHDLSLPEAFVPHNQDGEAVEHRLVGLADAARLVAHEGGPDEVTIDASAVVLDYLLRHRSISNV